MDAEPGQLKQHPHDRPAGVRGNTLGMPHSGKLQGQQAAALKSSFRKPRGQPSVHTEERKGEGKKKGRKGEKAGGRKKEKKGGRKGGREERWKGSDKGKAWKEGQHSNPLQMVKQGHCALFHRMCLLTIPLSLLCFIFPKAP